MDEEESFVIRLLEQEAGIIRSPPSDSAVLTASSDMTEVDLESESPSPSSTEDIGNYIIPQKDTFSFSNEYGYHNSNEYAEANALHDLPVQSKNSTPLTLSLPASVSPDGSSISSLHSVSSPNSSSLANPLCAKKGEYASDKVVVYEMSQQELKSLGMVSH